MNFAENRVFLLAAEWAELVTNLLHFTFFESNNHLSASRQDLVSEMMKPVWLLVILLVLHSFELISAKWPQYSWSY